MPRKGEKRTPGEGTEGVKHQDRPPPSRRQGLVEEEEEDPGTYLGQTKRDRRLREDKVYKTLKPALLAPQHHGWTQPRPVPQREDSTTCHKHIAL